MNEVQKIEFELLKQFLEICNRFNLRYYLVCGSALGAVKYKGFIPWDDDIDVALPREDYEIFLEKAQLILPDEIFLQNYRTDAEYPGLGSKLRNSNTTFIEKEASRLNYNHGIYIDVFPLDGYPMNRKEQRNFEKKKRKYYRRRYTGLIPFYHRDMGLTLLSLIRKCFGVFSSTAVACKSMESLMCQYPLKNSDVWCNYANSMSKDEYTPCEYYGKGVLSDFEGLKVVIPSQYDKYLTMKYGDWKSDIPDNQKVSGHTPLVVDVNKPYTEYFKEFR